MKRKNVRNTYVLTTDEDPLFRTLHTLEWDGTTYNVGDPIKIEGERGPFTFRFATYNNAGDPIVTVWWEGHHARSFYAEQIAGVGTARPALCLIHPHYTASRRPRSGCGSCYAAYEAKHPDRVA